MRSNGDISNDLDGPLTRFSRSRHIWSWISQKPLVIQFLQTTNSILYLYVTCGLWNGTLFGDLVWPLSASHRFVSISGASCIVISQPGIIQFQRNLVHRCKFCFQGWSCDKVPKFCKFKLADGRHIENRFPAIPQRFIVWLTRKFVQRSRIALRHRSHEQNIQVVNIWTAVIKEQI